MSYHLQARRAVGGAPGRRREETRLVEAEDLDAATGTARELAAEGFTVWIFRRTPRPALSAAPHPLRLVTTIGPPDAGAGRPERDAPAATPRRGPEQRPEQRPVQRPVERPVAPVRALRAAR